MQFISFIGILAHKNRQLGKVKDWKGGKKGKEMRRLCYIKLKIHWLPYDALTFAIKTTGSHKA